MVKALEAGIRLQDAKLYRDSKGRDLLILHFYPELRDLAFFAFENRVAFAPAKLTDKSLLKPTKTPAILYLKAHFFGKNLQAVIVSDKIIAFEFNDTSFEWNLEKQTWDFLVSGQKKYSQSLPRWTPLSSLQKQETKTAAQTEVEKDSSLIKNVKADLENATEWLAANEANIRYFLAQPALWGSDQNTLSPAMRKWIENLRLLKIPKFSKENRKEALEVAKKLLGRYLRKKEKSSARLELLKSELPKSEPLTLKQIDPKAHIKNKSSVGSKIVLKSGVEVLVGKNADENESLFRLAKSRDIWFHVRGQKGSHVWIRRGQKGFGAKDDLSQLDLEEAARLAAKYSKASGNWVPVDYAERRHLKKSKGFPAGSVVVLQSKTIFVSL